MSFETLHQVMCDIGPALDLAEVMAFPEHRLWTLAFDDGELIEAETDETGRRVLFSMEAGELSADNADASRTTMLEFNLLWGRTGGLHFALADRTAVLMLELPAAEIDVPTLSTVLPNLRAHALQWRPLLASLARPAPAETSPLAGGAIRV